MVNRVSAAGLQARPYFHRYTEDALDLCDVWASYGSGARVKLDEISKILGLPGKPRGIDGSQVEALVNAGRIDEVARYCESDVLTTYRVWLVYELFRGTITPKQLEWSETQAREFVATRKPANPHLGAAFGLTTQSDG
jgi:predicted PolB exonuclease-like 3'-5' exonuclease